MNASNAPTPSLYVSHGSPTFALETAHTSASAAYLRDFSASRVAPLGVVLISPHWHTRGLSVTGGGALKTVHDFGGFPAPLYALQYPARGDEALSTQVSACFEAAGLPCTTDPAQGLDHGAWVPLMKLYPQADVPVAQLSLPAQQSCAFYYALGQALAPLRERGIQIIGSGSMTHNLYDVRLNERQATASPLAPYVLPFRAWMQEKLAAKDLDALLNYRALAPFAKECHPTDEHLMPLFVAMGAAQFGQANTVSASYFAGELVYYTLAMDNVQFA